jgi:hypothetical protein
MNPFSPFNWIRNATKSAILNGCSDALTELGLDATNTGSQPLTLADLQQRLALTNAEPEEEPVSQRKKKS